MLLAAYYRPLVGALLAAADRRTTEDDVLTVAQLPGIDLALGISTAIVTIMRTLPLTGVIAADRLQDAGASLLDIVRTRLSSDAVAPELGDEGTASPALERRSYTGLDRVYVELGPTWPRTGR